MNNLLRRVSNKVLQEIDLTFNVWLQSHKFKADKNYDLSLVDKGFAERREEMQNDDDILNRICVAYNKSKDVQRHASSVYRPSNEWLPIYERPLKEVIRVLTIGDINSLSRIYSNFWRDPCSTGLVGLPMNMQKFYATRRISRWRKMLWLNDVLYRYGLWRDLLGSKQSIDDLDSPNIGNPYGFYIDDKFIVSGSDYKHYYATVIKRLTESSISKCVVELGAGFGGMPYYLLRNNEDISYVDLDLPENAALTAYYLLKAFPERKIRLFGEVDSIHQSIQKNEILIMPSFEIGHLPTGCAGLVFNSYSLAEMSPETIRAFIDEFSRLVCEGGHFMHVNHNRNSVVVADNFGVNSAQFKLLYKNPALWNKGRNSMMDEFEYLYRKADNNK
jgi:putative sugar O-methyltransferase